MKAKRNEILKIIIQTLAVAGLVVVSVVAPNALQIFQSRSKRFSKSQYQDSLRNLKRRGMVEHVTIGDQSVIALTKNGQRLAQSFAFDYMDIPRPKRWDRKWKIVIFDIPERKRALRLNFTARLKELGFVRVQKSVWAHPFIESELITEFCEVNGIIKFCRIIVAEKIDFDADMKQHYNL